jgi:hypothetical protein
MKGEALKRILPTRAYRGRIVPGEPGNGLDEALLGLSHLKPVPMSLARNSFPASSLRLAEFTSANLSSIGQTLEQQELIII